MKGDRLFVVQVMEVVFTQGRMGSIAGSKLGNLYFRESGWVTVSRVERFKLGWRVEVDLDRGNNVNGKDGIYACMDHIPGAPYHIRVQEGIQMFEGCS